MINFLRSNHQRSIHQRSIKNIIKQKLLLSHTNKKKISKLIITVNFATDKLTLISEKRGIKNYQNMSRKKLLSTLDKSERNFKNILQNELKRIAKMQNLSQNELEQITKMQNLLQNELEQIAKMRRIKNYKNMSKEELLIALLKSEQSHAELYKSKSNITEIEETRKIFNEIRNKFSKSVIKKIRKELYKKEKGLEN